MSTSDEGHVDFMHVSTYIPVILQLLRASVFLTLLEAVLVVQQHFGMLLALTALLTYFDGRAFYSDRLNRACGFLVPAGLVFCVNKATLMQFSSECGMSNTVRVVYYIMASAWATCGLGMLGMLSMDSLANVQSRVSENTFIFVSGVLGVANVYVECTVKSVPELFLRVGLYYLFTTSFILLHWSSHRTHRTLYDSVAKHITMHMLFVDLYVVVASMLLFIVFHVYVIRARHFWRPPPTTSSASVKGMSSVKAMDSARLAPSLADDTAIKELLAAKRAINMA